MCVFVSITICKCAYLFKYDIWIHPEINKRYAERERKCKEGANIVHAHVRVCARAQTRFLCIGLYCVVMVLLKFSLRANKIIVMLFMYCLVINVH